MTTPFIKLFVHWRDLVWDVEAFASRSLNNAIWYSLIVQLMRDFLSAFAFTCFVPVNLFIHLCT